MSKNTDLGNLVNGLFVSSTRNVGIGTTSIRNNGASQTAMQITGADFPLFSINGTSTGIGLNLGTGSSAGYIGTYTNHPFNILTNDSVRMSITTAGNVGINGTPGSFSNNVYFDIIGNTTLQGGILQSRNSDNSIIGSFFTNSNGLNVRTETTHPILLSPNGVERMRITSAGNVGIGTTSPALSTGTGLVVSNTTYLQLRVQSTTQSAGMEFFPSTGNKYEIQAGNDNSWFVYNRTVEAFRLLITGGGNILLGTTTDNGERLYVSGSIRATGSITANSDARLKKNIERIENALEKVGQISGYTYNTIYDEDRHAGLIAQEVELVLPEIVNSGTDTYKGIEYGNISALLVEAIKELSAEVQLLKNK